jgi:hypothetical protein
LNKQFTTPVLFLIFNRPETTKRVFECIREAKPTHLYIAADGARKDKIGEAELCFQTREIKKCVDWDCEVKTLFRNENLGCKIAVSSAINWFFENEEEGIILEDDCLPNQSFFMFCQDLLNYYREDERVMHIGGTNFQGGIDRGKDSYYFSKYNHIWGWATWKSAWTKYDVSMKMYSPEKTTQLLQSIFDTKREVNYWEKIFNDVHSGKINTWDYQWTYAIWKHNGVAVLPNKNLVSNIGFDKDATHTASKDVMSVGNIPTHKIDVITHPQTIFVDKEADRYGLNTVFYPTFLKFAIKKLINIISK